MDTKRGKRQGKASSLFAKIALLALGTYLIISLVITEVEIVSKRHELMAAEEQLSMQTAQNDELKRVLSSGNEDDYIERVAREKLGYARQDERIFQDTTGK